MSLTTIRRSDCDNGRTCPHVSATGTGTLVVQGYLVSGRPGGDVPGIPAGETVIEVPLDLLPELAAGECAGVSLTGHGTVVMHGPAVSDPGARAELVTPAGEAAIEVPAAALPFLGVAGRA